MRQLTFMIALAVNCCLTSMAQCSSGGAAWLYTSNNGLMTNTGLLGGYVTVDATTVGTMTSGRPLYQTATSVWKGLNYASLQVWRAYSSPGSNYTSFTLDRPLDSTYFHVRVDNIRGDAFNWESQNVRGYRNGVEVAADFKDPVNGASVSNNTISGASNTTSTMQSAMRVFFHGPVDSIVVRQTSWSDWVIVELMVECNVLLATGQSPLPRRPAREQAAMTISAFPNPCTNELNLRLPKGPHQVKVFSMSGQLVHTAQASGMTKINTASWQEGVYLIQLNNKGLMSTLRTVKMK